VEVDRKARSAEKVLRGFADRRFEALFSMISEDAEHARVTHAETSDRETPWHPELGWQLGPAQWRAQNLTTVTKTTRYADGKAESLVAARHVASHPPLWPGGPTVSSDAELEVTTSAPKRQFDETMALVPAVEGFALHPVNLPQAGEVTLNTLLTRSEGSTSAQALARRHQRLLGLIRAAGIEVNELEAQMLTGPTLAGVLPLHRRADRLWLTRQPSLATSESFSVSVSAEGAKEALNPDHDSMDYVVTYLESDSKLPGTPNLFSRRGLLAAINQELGTTSRPIRRDDQRAFELRRNGTVVGYLSEKDLGLLQREVIGWPAPESAHWRAKFPAQLTVVEPDSSHSPGRVLGEWTTAPQVLFRFDDRDRRMHLPGLEEARRFASRMRRAQLATNLSERAEALQEIIQEQGQRPIALLALADLASPKNVKVSARLQPRFGSNTELAARAQREVVAFGSLVLLARYPRTVAREKITLTVATSDEAAVLAALRIHLGSQVQLVRQGEQVTVTGARFASREERTTFLSLFRGLYQDGERVRLRDMPASTNQTRLVRRACRFATYDEKNGLRLDNSGPLGTVAIPE
jgi:hypothetical protein